jgi:hypothetical protein
MVMPRSLRAWTVFSRFPKQLRSISAFGDRLAVVLWSAGHGSMGAPGGSGPAPCRASDRSTTRDRIRDASASAIASVAVRV